MGPHEVKKKFNFLVENHYRVREKTLVESEYVINLSYTDKHGNQMVFYGKYDLGESKSQNTYF